MHNGSTRLPRRKCTGEYRQAFDKSPIVNPPYRTTHAPACLFAPAEKSQQGVDLTLYRFPGLQCGDIFPAAAPRDDTARECPDAPIHAEVDPRGKVAAPRQIERYKASRPPVHGTGKDELHDVALQPAEQFTTIQLIGTDDLRVDDTAQRLVVAPDDLYVETVNIVSRPTPKFPIKSFHTVGRKKIVVAEEPDPLLTPGHRHTARPLRHQVAAAQILPKAAVTHRETALKLRHDRSQVVRTAVVPDVNREVLARLLRQGLQRPPQKCSLIGGDDDSQRENLRLICQQFLLHRL